MAKIIGNTTATPNPQPDWLQTDDKKADYIKNKPMDYDAQMNAVSFGTNTHAGGKGFKVEGIIVLRNDVQITIDANSSISADDEVKGYQLNNGADLTSLDALLQSEVPLKFAVRLEQASHKDDQTIASIDSTKKQVFVNNAPKINLNKKTGSLYNILTIIGHPELGDVNIGIGAFTAGVDTYAQEYGAASFGYGNNSLGRYSFTAGNGNTAGYAGVAFNSNNKALGDQSAAFGNNNIVTGGSSLAEGNGNEITGNRSHAGGEGNKQYASASNVTGSTNTVNVGATYAEVSGENNTVDGRRSFTHAYKSENNYENAVVFGSMNKSSRVNQLVAGKLNDPEDATDALFVVGNGEQTTRKNAFVVHDDGRATVQTAGTEANDVVIKSQLDEVITNVEVDLTSYALKSDIPTNVSELNNDANYVTKNSAGAVSVGPATTNDHAVNGHLVSRYLGLTTEGTPDKLVIENNSDGNFAKVTDKNKSVNFGGEIVYIPSVKNAKPVYAIDAHAFDGNQMLSGVVVHNGIVNIADYAFNGCKQLTTIILSNSIQTIGTLAFNNAGTDAYENDQKSICLSLPHSLRILKSRAFQNCKITNEIIIPSKCIKIEDGVFNCDLIPAIRFEGKCLEISSTAFTGCTCDVYVPWSKEEVAGAPWGTSGTVYYNYQYATKEYVDDEIANIDIGDVLNIVQTTGYSETAVMSQKAVTETLEGKPVSETLTAFNEIKCTSNILSDKTETKVQRVYGGRAFVAADSINRPTYYEFRKTFFNKLVSTSKDKSARSEVDFGSVELGWNDVLDVDSGTKTTYSTDIFTFPKVERVEEPIYETAWTIDDDFTYWDEDEHKICKFTYDPYGLQVNFLPPPEDCTHGMVRFGSGSYDDVAYKSLEDVPDSVTCNYVYIEDYNDPMHDHCYLVFVTDEYGSVGELDSAGDIQILWVNGNDNDANVRTDTYSSRYPGMNYDIIYTNPGWVRVGSNVSVDWSAVGINNGTSTAFSYSINDIPVYNDTNTLCNFIADKIEYSETSHENKCTINPFDAPMVYYIRDGAFVVVLPGEKTIDQFLARIWTLQKNSLRLMQLYYETGEYTTENIDIDGSFVWNNGGTLRLAYYDGSVIGYKLTVELIQYAGGYRKQVSSHSDKDRLYVVDKNGDNIVVAIDDAIEEETIVRRDDEGYVSVERPQKDTHATNKAYVSDWFDWLNDYFGFTVGLEYVLTDDGMAYAVASAGLADSVDNVIILSKFKNKDVVEIGDDAFVDNTKITEVSVPDTVTSIGDRAFAGCSSCTFTNNAQGNWLPMNLTSVGSNAFDGTKIDKIQLPSGVKSISSGTFANCGELTEVDILHAMSSVADDAFSNSAIKKATIPDCALIAMPRNTLQNVTITQYSTEIPDKALEGCVELESVSIPSTVHRIGSNAFASCSKITDITLPNNLTSIEDNAFEGCSALQDITIPDSVTSIGESVLKGCGSVTNVIIPFIGQTRSDIVNTHFGYIFGAHSFEENADCVPESLKSVTVKNGDSIAERAFSNCHSIQTINVPDSVQSIGAEAFDGCSNLKNISIPSSVTFIGDNSFNGCDSLQYRVANGYLYLGNDTDKYILLMGSQSNGLDIIGVGHGTKFVYNNAFENYTNALKVEFDDIVDNIATDAFKGCKNLNKVEVNNVSNWMKIEFANLYANPLYYAKHLYIDDVEITEMEVPADVTTIRSFSFVNCEGLKTLVIPATVTNIEREAFFGCKNLNMLQIEDGSKLSSIDYKAFSECDNLLYFSIPDSVTSIGSSAFSHCDNLYAVVIPRSVETMNGLVFNECKNLVIFCKGQSAPSGWSDNWNNSNRPVFWNYDNGTMTLTNPVYTKSDTYKTATVSGVSDPSARYVIIPRLTDDQYTVDSIGARAFVSNGSLTGVIIPNSVTTIGDDAFYECGGLASIDIPDSVESIGNYAFYGCTNLKTVNITNLSTWCSLSFDGQNANPLQSKGSLCLNGRAITALEIPNSVTTIGAYSFFNCSSLTKVFIPAGVDYVGQSAFKGCNSNVIIMCESTSANSNWHADWNPDGLSVEYGKTIDDFNNYV